MVTHEQPQLEPPRSDGDTVGPSSKTQIDPSSTTIDVEKNPHNDTSKDAPYSILPERQTIFIMITASFAGVISPLSSTIYFPALTTLADAMHVSIARINLTIMAYLIFQGLAPSFIGSFSDTHGRRPAYLICFTIYLGANIGLALQNNYAALMVLRCLQACGSSGTIALGSAVVADVSTRAERGKYIGYASMGVTLGPALGPVIGGLLDHFLGWRWIFWFLTILGGVFFLVIIAIFPETCRAVVGNGSIPASKWNLPLLSVLHAPAPTISTTTPITPITATSLPPPPKRPNPLQSARLAADKENLLILIYGALLYSGMVMVLSTLSPELSQKYTFNSIQIGLCYLPMGLGSLTSRWTVGVLLDRNFRRLAQTQSLSITKNQQQSITNFNIERARLAITIPLVYLAALSFIAYGWVMVHKTSLAGPVVTLFFGAHFITGAFTALSTLIVDLNRNSPATAVAANNLFRCLLGAGASAVAAPMIDGIGIGWAGTLIALLWVVLSPCVWAVYSLKISLGGVSLLLLNPTLSMASSKIYQICILIDVEEHIGCLRISPDDIVGMQVCKCVGSLIDPFLSNLGKPGIAPIDAIKCRSTTVNVGCANCGIEFCRTDFRISENLSCGDTHITSINYLEEAGLGLPMDKHFMRYSWQRS
ncbi:MFS general substrate transporter [Aspergillus ellipticus CBS 707.79]|uniref:MFS general substrate transporter n=1 Tax=Aspergillus ellipticus CBS 707.79 TaxID=1448320 RepID=A0A319E2Y1_9EURO|nr:MFS general substrate transporter [Aspergillus ellipticus CBS 707.79]